jgi:hypothetical protein
MNLVMGPVLGFRGQANSKWHVCAIVVTGGDGSAPALEWTAADEAGGQVGSGRVEGGQPLKSLGARSVWRFAWSVEQGADERTVTYSVAGATHRFVVPAKERSRDYTLRAAYASCNGFSSVKDMKGVRDQDALWHVLLGQHVRPVHWEGMQDKRRPYHLLVLGGDQLYSDEIWGRLKTLRDWNDLSEEDKGREPGRKIKKKELRAEIEHFYFDIYCRQWARGGMREVLASVPTLMMWDDHDIFDGWGSYSEEKQRWEVFRYIFEGAREHFCLLQLQATFDELEKARKEKARNGSQARFGGEGSSELPALLPGQPAFSYAYRVDDTVLVAPDMRSERTRNQVMSDGSRQALYDWMDTLKPEECRNFVLLSPIPLVYVNSNLLEGVLGWAPWQDDPDSSWSLNDDLADQWMTRGHRVERLRLINRLLAFADKNQCRVTVVSGDVHVGGMGRIEARAGGGPPREPWTINQLISSPIVHPPLQGLVLFLLEQKLDGAVEEIERGSRDITAQMVKLPTAGRHLISARNWLSLTFDYRRRIWAEWFIENLKPPARGEAFDKLSQVIHPVDFFDKK